MNEEKPKQISDYCYNCNQLINERLSFWDWRNEYGFTEMIFTLVKMIIQITLLYTFMTIFCYYIIIGVINEIVTNKL